MKGATLLPAVLLVVSLVSPAPGADLPECSRILPGPSFPREILTGLETTPAQSHEMPSLDVSSSSDFDVLAVHWMDLEGNGQRVPVVVDGILWQIFGLLRFPGALRRIDPASGETVWTQELPGGLFGPGVVEDLDGDGRDDLRFDQFLRSFFFFSPAGFQFFWGEGDGPLAEGFRTRSSPVFSRLEDVDGDGLDDAVVGIGADLTVYPGTSARTFDEGIAYTTIVEGVHVDEPGRQLEVGDLDEDGLDDVVAFTQYEFTQTIGISRGDGTFDLRELPLPAGRPAFGRLHDLDGDGHLDVVLQDDTNLDGFWVGWGRGDGTFEPYVFLSVGGDFYFFELGDLTGDGQADIVVVYVDSPDPGNVSVVATIPMHGREIGVPVPFELPGWNLYLQPLTLADLDGDDLDDLVFQLAKTSDSARLAWLPSLGDGRVGLLRDILDAPLTHRIEWIHPTDFDLDGAVDLFVQTTDLGPGGRSNISLRGDGSGDFETVFQGGPLVSHHYDLLVDIDADGWPDLVGRREYEAYEGDRTYDVVVRPGDGLGGFLPPIERRWLSFAGVAGRFRETGTLDMARIGYFGDRTTGPYPFGSGLYQLEVNPSTGYVLPHDQAPPTVEMRFLPVTDDVFRVATLPRDECSSRPRVTGRLVDLLPLAEGIPFTYRKAATDGVLVYEVPGTGRRGVVLSGPDSLALRDAFFAALDDGGFPFRHMEPMHLSVTDAYGDPLPAFPAARLVQGFELRDGFVSAVEVSFPGARIGFTVTADDGVHTATTRHVFSGSPGQGR